MVSDKEIIEYLGNVRFDDGNGGIIYSKREDGSERDLITLCFNNEIFERFRLDDKSSKYDYDKIDDFEYRMGCFISDAINEKIQRENT